MTKNEEEELEEFWLNLLDSFLITMLLQPNNKIRVLRSAKNIIAEVNRAKRAERKLNQIIKGYFGGTKAEGNQYIKYDKVLIALIDNLGRNVPLSKEVERKTKLFFDYTKPSKREQQWIRWQVIAQMIALEDPRKRVSAIRKEILGDHRLDRLLEFSTLPSLGNPLKQRDDRFREIENSIGKVVKWGVGRPAKNAQSTVLISPMVYSNGKVNFQALLAVLSAVGSALKIWGRPVPENYVLPVIDLYQKNLPASPIIDAFIDMIASAFYGGFGKGQYYD